MTRRCQFFEVTTMRCRSSSCTRFALAVTVALSASRAYAQGGSGPAASPPAASAPAANLALAETLFRDGASLFEKGNYREACPKLEESYRLDPGTGTLYNLAQCREKEGKIAAAWSHYSELQGRAARSGQADREAQMRSKVSELGQRVPKLTLNLGGRIDVASVTVDGAALGRVAWSTPLPLDPGAHTLRFEAANRQPLEKRITLAERELRALDIEPLEAAVVGTAPSSPADPTQVEPSSGRRLVGLVVGGLGVVGLGVGVGFGLAAIGQKNEADDLYATKDRGYAAKDEGAGTSALLSTIGFGVGVVGLVAGTYLVVTSGTPKATGSRVSQPKSVQGRVWATPAVGPAGASLAVGATF